MQTSVLQFRPSTPQSSISIFDSSELVSLGFKNILKIIIDGLSRYYSVGIFQRVKKELQ
jgi:hypothetical protein